MKQFEQTLFQSHARTGLLAIAIAAMLALTACSQRAAPIGNASAGSNESGPVAMALPIAAPGDFSNTPASAPARPAPFAAPPVEPALSQTGAAVIVSGGPANLGELKLSLVQICTPTRSGNPSNARLSASERS